MKTPWRFWLLAKEWTEVQRLNTLAAMSRKLAGGSQKAQRKQERAKGEMGRQRQIALGLGGLVLLAASVDLSRPKGSLLMQAVGPESVLETQFENAATLFASLKKIQGPGTADQFRFPTAPATSLNAKARIGTNGLQE